MKKFVVMSGGFHPFHAGHADLYQQAKEAFPDAKVLVCATNVQSDRPFPFSLKKKLAQLSGVPPKDFIEVSRQFTIQDPALAQRIGNPDDAIVIYVRSDKDRNEPPTPWKLGPDGKPPVGKRGAKKGLPLSDYLLEYPGKGQPLDPVSKHAYMAYLRTVEFGPGITSASEIRNAWPKLNAKRKLAMIMSLYPTTKSNPQLAQNVVGMFDQVMGGQVDEGWKDVVASGALALSAIGAGAQTMPNINAQQVELANKYYNVLVQRAKEDGIPLDTRTLNIIKAKAQDAAAKKTQQSTPQQGFPSQGSERRVAKDAGQFESKGVAEAKKKKKKKTSRSLSRYFFPGYAYYGGYGGEGGGDGGDGGGGGEGKIKEGDTARIFHPQYVDVYYLDGPRRTPILVNRKVPYNLVDRYLELAIKKYNLQQGRFEFRNAEEEKVAEGLGIPYPTTYEQENDKFKRRGPMRITAMTEFAPPGSNDREPDEEEILRQLAAQWWNGTDQQMKKAQQTLQAMGWEIGQDESGDDDAGVFVIRIGDVNGDSYIAFPHSELGLNEDYLNEI